MTGNLSDFQAENIRFLRLFLSGVKNAEPQHGTPEIKMQKMSFL